MIIVKLMGGLGNQMFQYAAGRTLAKRLNTSLVLDISGYEDMHPDDTPRTYELGCFPIRASIASDQDLSRVRSADYQPGYIERVKRQVSSNGPIFTYGESSDKTPEKLLQLRNNTYLVGWWQNEDYFNSIKDDLIKDFTPKRIGVVSKKYQRMIQESPQTVALHVRRGDYVTNTHANIHHGLTPLDYYRAAIIHMTTQLDNPTFFVFSDDIPWCKTNIKAQKIVYIERTSSGYEDMRLMSLCEHNIIANSSFSWWGAWLNKSLDKIVIAPKTWFQDNESNINSKIVPDNWIRL